MCLKSIELYDSQSNSWKSHGEMNYRRSSVGIGVIKVSLYESNLTSNVVSTSPDDMKNSSLL